MKNYDHLAPLIQQDNPAFEEWFADMVSKIPALRGRGKLEIPVAGFKSALKAAYVAGDSDAIERIINSNS
jgi:hypothetical protein